MTLTRTRSVFALAAGLAGCASNLSSEQVGPKDTGFEDVSDLDGPIIEHSPVEEAQPLGTDVDIYAVIVDEESGVFLTKLYYKNETSGSGDWESTAMTPLEADEWVGTIPGEAQSSGGMNYYISAVDAAQNESASPEKGAEDPWHFRLYE